MEDLGFIRIVVNVECTSPPLLVLKLRSIAKYHLKVDFRAVKAETVKTDGLCHIFILIFPSFWDVIKLRFSISKVVI